MSTVQPADYFTKARSIAASLMFAAGVAAILGAFLDWVKVTPPETVPASQAARLDPFTGVETTDGWIVVVAGAVVIVCAALVVVRARSGWAWLAFFVSMAFGGIAVADYRDIARVFYDEMDRIGLPEPGVGLTLVAVAGVVGVVASAAAAAASPRREA